jgi:hypothetical protein
VEREEIRPPLIADLQKVLEAGGDEVCYSRPGPLEQRIGPTGRRQAHRHRRQQLTLHRLRDQPRRQQRRLLVRPELDRTAGKQVRRQPTDNVNPAVSGVVRADPDAAIIPQDSQLHTVQQTDGKVCGPGKEDSVPCDIQNSIS